MPGKVPLADLAWGRMDRPENLMVITGLLWFDGPVDPSALAERVRRRVVERYPRFRSVVDLPRRPFGRATWRELPEVPLDAHLGQVHLAPPGDRRALAHLVGDTLSRPLDPTRPLWSLTLVDGFEGGSAIVARLHHCLADGVTLARILLSLTDDARGREVGAWVTPHLPPPPVGPWAQARRLLATARATGKLLFLPPDPRSAVNGAVDVRKQATWTDPWPLDEVKHVAHRFGVTVNDVLTAAVTGALHRHLVARGTPRRHLHAAMPYNLRALEGDIPTDLGNRFGMVFPSLPVGLTDPVARLREVARRMDAIKASPEGPVSYAILGLIGRLPGPLEPYAVDLFAAKASLVLTNVPGPREPVFVAGRRALGVLAWVPQSGRIGLGVSIVSYAGEVRVGLAADAGLIPDLEGLRGDVAAEYAVLRDAAGQTRAA